MRGYTGTRWMADGRGELSFGLGVAVLSATKALDAVTTVVGLTAVDHLEEGNELVARTMAVLGVDVALVVISVLTIAGITLSTEAGRRLAAGQPDPSIEPATVRLVGYGTPSLYHVGIATYNLILITGG